MSHAVVPTESADPRDRATVHRNGLGLQLRYWRGLRGLSQLDLALQAELSARHVSFLETGRSKASEQTLVQLAVALQLSAADAMSLKRANAGVNDRPHQPDAATKATLRNMVDSHSPFPALIVDSIGTLHHTNDAMRRLIDLLRLSHAKTNLYELYFAPDGFGTIVVDAERIAPVVFAQVRRDLLAANRPDAIAMLEHLSALAPELARWESQAEYDDPNPVIQTVLQAGARRLQLSSLFASFGSVEAGNRSDWRVETVFPVDDQTAAFFAGSG